MFPRLVREQKSHAVPAGLGTPDALARMLEGTGLEFRVPHAAEHPHPCRGRRTAARDHDGHLLGEELQEVIVTANRREENLQDVPITIQVLAGEELRELTLNTINDAIKYTANVTYSGNGPGTGNIFIRGLGSPGTGNQSQSTVRHSPTSPFTSMSNRCSSRRATMTSIWSIWSASKYSRARKVRCLAGELRRARFATSPTNRGGCHHADLNASYGITAGGDPNSSADVTLNLPLIADKFAVRAVGFVDRRVAISRTCRGRSSFDFPASLPA